MGWASFFEDIRDRNLERLRNMTGRPRWTGADRSPMLEREESRLRTSISNRVRKQRELRGVEKRVRVCERRFSDAQRRVEVLRRRITREPTVYQDLDRWQSVADFRWMKLRGAQWELQVSRDEFDRAKETEQRNANLVRWLRESRQ